jgi:hypothetical protein
MKAVKGQGLNQVRIHLVQHISHKVLSLPSFPSSNVGHKNPVNEIISAHLPKTLIAGELLKLFLSP